MKDACTVLLWMEELGEEEWSDEEEEEDEPYMIHYCEVAMDVKILVGF